MKLRTQGKKYIICGIINYFSFKRQVVWMACQLEWRKLCYIIAMYLKKQKNNIVDWYAIISFWTVS